MIKVILLALLIFANSCNWASDSALPNLTGFTPRVPNGTPIFKRGFKDGCSSTTYARGNFLYRMLYKHRYDTKMIGSPEYRFGYSRGYSICFHLVLGGGSAPQASFDRYLLPYGQNSVFHMSVDDDAINDAWGGFFGGIWKGDLTNARSNTKGGLESVVNIWQKSSNGGQSALGSDPLWSGGSKGQIFGQRYHQ